MNLDLLITHRELIIALMAAISASLALMVVFWPYLAPDTLEIRMRQVVSERERIRLRERARMKSEKRVSLRTEPKKLFKDIVDRFNLTGQADDGQTVKMLRMAGYRGQSPVVTFVAVRMLMPFVMFAIAAVYVFVLLDLQQPLFVKLAITLGAACLGYYAPAIYLKNKITKRQQAIRRAWPDALDLLLICVESGMSIESALKKVADEIGTQSIELGEELSLTTAEMSYLPDRRKAYENLGERTGVEAIRAAVTSLIQAEKYGTSLGQSLRVLAQESRDMRMSEAEKKAASLPPKLTVPMIIFFLPVLFAVVLGPAGIQIANLP